MPQPNTSRFIMLAAAPILSIVSGAVAGERTFEELRRFPAEEARQGVAVDETAFYAITNRAIGKYDKRTGERLARWEASAERPLVHLNAGLVVNGKLYCAHSNYPLQPVTSSVEIWDAETLEHTGTHSFGVYEGSLTWIDWYGGHMWAVFAHYGSAEKPRPGEKDNRWTTLVQFDNKWQRKQAWIFPPQVIERFGTYSNSGGAWGPDGRLYCTGHDHSELYVLRLPKAGATLDYVETIPCPITGQAFAWDRTAPATLYGIDRAKKQVVVVRLREE